MIIITGYLVCMNDKLGTIRPKQKFGSMVAPISDKRWVIFLQIKMPQATSGTSAATFKAMESH